MAKPFQDCVLLLGDSLTGRQDVPHNLQARFSKVYQRSYDTLNRGFGGYNSNWCLALLDHILARKGDADIFPRIRLVTIWLGINDSSFSEQNNKGVPIPQFKSNVGTILEHLTSPTSPYAVAHSDVPVSIILITTPPVEETMRNDPNHVNDASAFRYKEAMCEVGADWVNKRSDGDNWKLGVIDLYSSFKKAGKLGVVPQLFADGVHLSTAGYDVLWAEIDRMIHTEFKGRGIDWNDQADLPWTAPIWSEPAQHGTERVLQLLRTRSHNAGDGI